MTGKERLTRCYFGQETDRPAVYSRTSFPDNDPSYDRLKAYLARFSDLKGGFSARSSLCEPYPSDMTRENYSKEYDKIITVLHTPAGDLRSVWLEGLDGRPGMMREHFIKDEDDCKKYLSLPIPKIAGNSDDFFEKCRKMGDKGIIEAKLGNNPGGAIADLMGSETFAILTATDRDLVHEMCGREMEIQLQIVAALVKAGAGPFFSMLGEEYIVPPLHGRRDFDDFNVRYDKPIVDAIHNAGGRIHIHCHGPLSLVLSGFLEIGADVLHPIEPPPIGNVTAAQAREALGGRVCIEGNIQISSMYENTPDQIREETEALIHDAYVKNKGLIVSPTASPYIPGGGETCFGQYKAMIDTVLSSCERS